MSRLDQLLSSFRRHVSLPLRGGLPLSQRVWFVVYPPDEERRLQPRLPEFEIATSEAKLGWKQIDLTGIYTDWINSLNKDERETCLETPAILEAYSDGFLSTIKEKIQAVVTSVLPEHRERSVFAMTGTMEFFDFVHVSDVVESLDNDFPGIFLVFFPGEREGNTYRFLGARDGWDYLAIPITADHAH
jgi:hypothetical protein